MEWRKSIYLWYTMKKKKENKKIHIMGIPEEKEKNDKKVYLKQNDWKFLKPREIHGCPDPWG